ncbi:hypothetical protein EDB84DRAFT_1163814 [Lactarius hengduanensis]|nr:hypothetical protein EDB84DRAFT_1163814 [Lactarius hengduanensis]
MLLNGTCQWHAKSNIHGGVPAALERHYMVIWCQSPLASASVLHCDWVWSPCAVQVPGAHRRPKILYEATKSDERPYGTLGHHCAASIPAAGPPECLLRSLVPCSENRGRIEAVRTTSTRNRVGGDGGLSVKRTPEDLACRARAGVSGFESRKRAIRSGW